jgi:hypothetical protein
VKKRLFIFILIAIMMVLLVSVSAEKEYAVEDFDSESSGLIWEAGNAVTFVSTMFSEDSESICLRAHGSAAEAVSIKTVYAEPFDSLDLSEYKFLKVNVKVDDRDIGNAECFARIIVTTVSGERAESISSIAAGEWDEITIDLTSLKLRNEIAKIEIGVVPDQIYSEMWYGGFYIDNLIAFGYIDPILTERFSMNNYKTNDCLAEFAHDNMFFTLSPTVKNKGFSIEFETEGTIKSYTNALRINLENNSDTQDFNAFFLDRNGNLIHAEYCELSTHSKQETVYLDVPNPGKIHKVRLEFPPLSGNILINAIEFADVYDMTEYITYGTITESYYNKADKTIDVYGEIPKEYVTEFKGCSLYLYALEPYENPKKYDFENATPVSKCQLSSEFHFKADASKNGDSLSAKKFVAVIDTSPKVYISHPFFIGSTSKAMAFDTFTYGVCTGSSLLTGESGAKSTIIDVHLDRLISTEKGGLPYFYDNKYYYFSASYIERLERETESLASSGVYITLRLLVNSDAINPLVYASDDTTRDNYLTNITNTDGYLYFKAAVSFLASKCYIAGNGLAGVDSFIVGENVNLGTDTVYAPAMSMTELVHTYANLLRAAEVAANNPDITVYASVSDVMAYTARGYTDNRYESLDFLEALDKCIKAEGDFPWGICVEASADRAQNKSDKIFSLDKISSAAMLFENTGKTRPTIIAATWGKGSTDPSLIINSLMGDAVSDFKGRYIIDLNSCDNESRNLILKYVSAFLSGNTDTIAELNIERGKYEHFKNRNSDAFIHKTEAELSPVAPADLKGSYRYFDFDQNYQLTNFISSYGTGSVKLTDSENGTPAMTTIIEYNQFETMEKSYAGVAFINRHGIAFENTPAISFDVSLADLSVEPASDIGLIIRFIGKNFIHDCKTEINADEAQTLYADIGNIKGQHIESIQFIVTASQDKQFELKIDNLCGYSTLYDNDTLSKLMSEKADNRAESGSAINPTVILVFAVAITALSTLTIILKLRRKSSGKS